MWELPVSHAKVLSRFPAVGIKAGSIRCESAKKLFQQNEPPSGLTGAASPVREAEPPEICGNSRVFKRTAKLGSLMDKNGKILALSPDP